MDQELELSELILRAFLIRQSRLTRLGSGLTLVGSRFDVDGNVLQGPAQSPLESIPVTKGRDGQLYVT